MEKHIQHPIFSIIAEAASELKIDAYAIGGFVRDIILERPCKDIDVVAIGSGIKLAELVAKKIGNKTKVTVFKNFGTAMLLYKQYEVEFVGARKESYDRGSRKPIVEDGTLEDDQNRRDFTINAMASPLEKGIPTVDSVIDPHDGRSDLAARRIRLVAAEALDTDPLRMLRGIRFTTLLDGFAPDENFVTEVSRRAPTGIPGKSGLPRFAYRRNWADCP